MNFTDFELAIIAGVLLNVVVVSSILIVNNKRAKKRYDDVIEKLDSMHFDTEKNAQEQFDKYNAMLQASQNLAQSIPDMTAELKREINVKTVEAKAKEVVPAVKPSFKNKGKDKPV